MWKNLFDTCVVWSCVTRCRCGTTSSTLFTVYKWSMFFSAVLSLPAGKMRENYLVPVGLILQFHKRLPVSIFSVKIAASGSFEQVTGRTFKNSK
jgi:hypothetical protein